MPAIGDEVEIWKPSDPNHERYGKVARETTPKNAGVMWPTRRFEVEFEGGMEKAEYPEFSLRPVKPVKVKK